MPENFRRETGRAARDVRPWPKPALTAAQPSGRYRGHSCRAGRVPLRWRLTQVGHSRLQRAGKLRLAGLSGIAAKH